MVLRGVLSVAAWATLACVVAVVLTAAVGIRNSSATELASLHQAPRHGVTAKASRQGLASYFHRQSLAIKQQLSADKAQKKRHMSAAAANADLDKYFDSLQSHTKKGKLETLAREVTDLSKDVKSIITPVKQLQDSAAASRNAVSSLQDDTKALLRDEKSHQEVAERAMKAAEKAAATSESAAESAKKAANGRRARDETIVVRQALRRAPKTRYVEAKEVNPKMTVEGLPPNWNAYMDRKTKYAYFYNKKTRKSSWINPKGDRAHVTGLPTGWEALKEKGGEMYYVNTKSGRSTFEDPRVIPGAKVLAMINSDDKRRAEGRAMHKQAEKMAKLSVLSDNHGVFSHNFARSQWADKDWMSFLDKGHGADKSQTESLETTNEALAQGEVGGEQAMPQRVSSSSY